MTAKRAGNFDLLFRVRGRSLAVCSVLACVVVLWSGGLADAAPGDEFWSADFHLPGLDGEPFAYAEWNGMLAVGGEFHAVGPVLAERIALFDGEGWRALGEGIDGPVLDLAEWQGELVACGNFSRAGGVAATNVAAWDGQAWHALGEGVPDGVRAITVFGGRLHCDRFRWNGLAWEDVLQTDGVVRDFVEQDGLLVAGGGFTTAGGIATGHVLGWDGGTVVNCRPGQAAIVVDLEIWEGGLFALHQAGTPEATESPVSCWQNGAWVGTPGLYPADYNQGYHALALRGGELVLAGWWWEGLHPVWDGKLFHWDGSRWLEEEGQSQAEPTSLYDWDGSLVIGGRFSAWDGVAAAGIVRLVGARAEAMVAGGLAPAGTVVSLAAAESLAISGSFGAVGHQVANGVAVWNGGGWDPRSVALTWAGGSVAWHDGALNCIATLYSDYIDYQHLRWYSGGWGFFSVHVPSAKLLSCGQRLLAVTWSAVYDATNPLSWQVLAEASGGWIADATVWDDRLVLYGDFAAIGGTPAAGLAVLDGDQWQGWVAPTAITRSRAIAVWQDRLVVAGSYDGDAAGARTRVVAQDEAGWRVIADNIDGGVAALAGWGSQLFAGGSFRRVDAVEAANVARWDGRAWYALGGGTDGAGVNALAVSAGRLWVGGGFARAGGRPAANLCTWRDPAVPVFVGAFGAARLATGGVRLTWRTAEATEGEFVVERSSPSALLPAVAAARRTSFELVDDGAPDGRLDYRLRHRMAGGEVGAVLCETAVAARDLPAAPWLAAPAPNPFNPAVTLRFALAVSGRARLVIYDVQGRCVVVLAEGEMPAGEQVAVWRGEDARGRTQPSGVYLARLEMAGTTRTVKLMLAR